MEQGQREKFLDLLETFDIAMLITFPKDSPPVGRPMAIAQVADDTKVWFITGIESQKVHEIADDAEVCITCQRNHSLYLSVSGTARAVRDRQKIRELWKESFQVWFPEGPNDPTLGLIEFTPKVGEYWDSEGVNKFKYTYAAIKAYVTGTTPVIPEEQHAKVQIT